MLKFLWKWLYKWLWCSWRHPRCYPQVWDEATALQYNLPWKGENYWHCEICHPCCEALDKLLSKENIDRIFSDEDMV
jgi:hypothetical protein